MDDRTAALRRAHELAQGFLDGLNDRPVWPRAAYGDMLAALDTPLPENPTPAEDVVGALAEQVDDGLVAIPGGRFFGFVNGATHPAALAADWLTSTWDQNAGLASMSPAAAAAETVAGRWLLELLGLPAGSSVGFVTGGMMANFSCLASARHSVLAAAGWDVAEHGLAGAPPVRVVVGEHRHDTIDRAARLLGLGSRSLLTVPADGQGRIRPDALAETLDGGSGPTIVCLQAGEVHTGDFDPFTETIPIVRRHDAWVHVDGAFGLWAAASPATRHLLAGVADADSWATDAHKTLNVPYDSGLAIVRDKADVQAVFGVRADYLIAAVEDPLERTPEFSRRARGFPILAVLRSLGRSGVEELVARLCARATQMAEGIAPILGAEVLNDVVFTQVLTAFGDDDTTRAVGQRLLADGTAVFTPSVWAGRAVQRCSVSSWATTREDVEKTLTAVRRAVSA